MSTIEFPCTNSLKNSEIIAIHHRYLIQVTTNQIAMKDHPFLVNFNEKEFFQGVNDALEQINEVLADQRFQLFAEG
jgi:hypothetical protein